MIGQPLKWGVRIAGMTFQARPRINLTPAAGLSGFAFSVNTGQDNENPAYKKYAA